MDARTPHAEAVVKTLAGLGVHRYRWGGFKYDFSKPIPAQLDELKGRVKELFIAKAYELARAHDELARELRAKTAVYRADARQFPLADSTVDLVVTSPPYVGTYDYAAVQELRAALFPHPDGLRKRAKARILTKRLKASGRDFSEALQSGAAKLLATSAKKIDAGVEKLTQGRDKS